MANLKTSKRILSLFADILEYPRPGLGETLGECQALLLVENPEASAMLDRFRKYVEEKPLGRLEEEYTESFDMHPGCYPYVSYHLLGESYKRSVFLLELKERYRAQGFTVKDKELPDHVSVMLKFLATSEDEPLNKELLKDAVIPALEKMLQGMQDEETEPGRKRSQKAYQYAVEALRMVLEKQMNSDELAGAKGASTREVRDE
ncbi:MAG: nitrate reductase molybdenum cofactor assembly chaperone [Chloroflexi bacterium]|nr:nitrate reductase molybdenum cofactor assembly chaperone [Chloroflexota bacterium]